MGFGILLLGLKLRGVSWCGCLGGKPRFLTFCGHPCLPSWIRVSVCSACSVTMWVCCVAMGSGSGVQGGMIKIYALVCKFMH